MLLFLLVLYHVMVDAQVDRDLNRSKAWTCEWLKRYYKDGMDGLKNRPKSDIPPPVEISEGSFA